MNPNAGAPAEHPAIAATVSGWSTHASCIVLETGFGRGDIFLRHWCSWREQAKHPAMLHWVGILSAAEAAALPGVLQTSPDGLAACLADACFGLDGGLHRVLLDGGQVSLTLCVGEVPAMLAQQALGADHVLAHAAQQPWDKWRLKALARCCKRGTQLLFSGAPLPEPHLLGDAGFVTLATPAWPLQQHARYDPHWQLRSNRQLPHAAPAAPGRCAVIGAGMAGASVARALAMRGWRVDVYDTQTAPAGGASGLPMGLVVPHHSADDSPRSRMSRKGTRLMLQHARSLLREGQDWKPGGALELRIDEAGLEDVEAEVLSHSKARQAATGWSSHSRFGPTPGLWHPHAAWIKPACLIAQWLDHPHIHFHGAAAVHALQQRGTQWLLRDAAGVEQGQADIVVLANAYGSAALVQRLVADLPGDFPWLPDVLDKLQALQAMDGTLSMGICPALAPDATAFPPFPVNGHGSFVSGVPTEHGPAWYAGSTFHAYTVQALEPSGEHATNLKKLQTLLPAAAHALAAQFAHGKVKAWQGTRCISHDRLPLVGPLDSSPNPTLWLCAAMGARGLSFSALCAELLAAWLGAEPLPIENNLATALSTRRLHKQKEKTAAA